LPDLTRTGYRARGTAVPAIDLYVNFLSHHWLPDLRRPLGGLLPGGLLPGRGPRDAGAFHNR
jgi:hypothetical protein